MDTQVRRRKRAVIIVLVGTALALMALVPVANRLLTSELSIVGIDEGATVSSVSLRDASVVGDSVDLSKVDVLVDGASAEVRPDDRGRLLLAQQNLAEGPHVITVRQRAAIPLMPDREVSRRFTVDDSAPPLVVDAAQIKDLRTSLTFSGRAPGAASLVVNEEQVTVAEDGTFTTQLSPVPTKVRVSARDSVGNESTQEVPVQAQHPGMRAVHMSALAWASSQLREPVLRMAREGRIDAVQLDIKDESGEVGYASAVPLAKEIGAARQHYDAKAAVRQLHDAGLRVVGRIVAFRDPILARASWNSGNKQRVIQTADGRPWSGSYGQYAFTNYADADVRRYNTDLAVEAADLGFDDILYDYVRRPEGQLGQMRTPGFTGKPTDAIADFLAGSRDLVHKHGAFVGASVFGIAADRPEPVGQDIPAISRAVDYIAPMVYPSHWGPGEYGVAHPETQPYDITAKSVSAFVARSRDGGAQVFPWLQAFSLRTTYGAAEVRAQIDAARQSGASSFLLWNASCRYEPAGLDVKR